MEDTVYNELLKIIADLTADRNETTRLASMESLTSVIGGEMDEEVEYMDNVLRFMSGTVLPRVEKVMGV